MDKDGIIKQTEKYVSKTLLGESSGHDWWHIYRVWKMAKRIAQEEKDVDVFVIELAALLHDIADWKLHGGDESIGPKKTREWLEKLSADKNVILHVCAIIQTMAFKGAKVATPMATKEGQIVQDADRLDAIGAIGIARTFAFGRYKGRPIYDPTIKPTLHESSQQYITSPGTTINHFYEKLLLLKDLMNTKTAKRIAQDRHKYMEDFLEKFFKEWEGKE